MKIQKQTGLTIKFENNEEVEVLKNICEFTDFLLASACVTGGIDAHDKPEYNDKLRNILDKLSESRSLVNKIINCKGD